MVDALAINADRLARTFTDLVRIDSVSKEEGRLCTHLRTCLDDLGAVTHVDDAGEKVGGDTGNLVAKFEGRAKVPPLLLSAHMDTVEPGRGVTPLYKDGVFTSAGDTILGADDKCGLAIILEVLTTLKEQGVTTGPLEVVFSICEELGLQGAQHLDFKGLNAVMGFVMDTRHIGVLINQAPAANHIRFEVVGRAAHAGAEPEKGISAIVLASQAIARARLGRMDAETTCNIGTMHGGMATNIVPERVVVEAEVRSHHPEKLDAVTQILVDVFQAVVDGYGTGDDDDLPRLNVDIVRAFDRVSIDEEHEVVVLAKAAAAQLGQALACKRSGGGSDASVFTRNGIVSGVLGTGCDKVHTVDERVALKDMVASAQLLMTIIQLHAQSKEVV